MSRVCCENGEATVNVNGAWLCDECARGIYGRGTPRTEADQLAALAPYFTRALKLVEAHIAHCYEDVMRAAVERMREGYVEHGSSLFTKPTAEIDRDVLEELADAVVYQAELVRRSQKATAPA